MPLEVGPSPSGKDNGQKDPPRRPDKASRPGGGEATPGPSSAPQRQGYCSCCQVLYSNVEQHLMSPRHREVVRTSRSNVATGSLMDRFLQDVMRHHPHRYNDTRPTHADLPLLTTLPPPREELSEVYCGSKDDKASVGTREEMPSSDDESCPPAPTQMASFAPRKDVVVATKLSMKAMDAPSTSTYGCTDTSKPHLNPPLFRKDSPTQGFLHRTSSSSLQTLSQSKQTTKAPAQLTSAQTHLLTETLRSKDPTPEQPSNSQSQHRKANKKTNRHGEGNDSASGSQVGAQPSRVPTSKAQASGKPGFESPVLWAPAMPPWKSAHRERTFSDISDQINQVINEVIDFHCYGRVREQKQPDSEADDDDGGSFRLSLHSMSNSAESKGWDDTLQATLDAPKVDEKNLTGLMETHISLEDQKYKSQLDSALKPAQDMEEEERFVETEVRAISKANVSVDEVLPDLPHIPPSFVGKTWAQVMQEDDLKIDSLVKEFREGHFRCYFDTESLARYGKHRRRKARKHTRKSHPEEKATSAVECTVVLPLMEHTEEDVAIEQEQQQQQQPALPQKEQTAQPRKRYYRLASRCQVVKVSHGTQTTGVSFPMVRRKTVEGVSASLDDTEPSQGRTADSANETPQMKTRLCALSLPASYSKVMSPLQPKTVVYVLSSPADSLPSLSKQPGKRRPGGGRKKKTCDLDSASKYKYKRTPLKYYDPLTNRILKSPPKGAPTTPNPKYYPHVRQLFRSLSPDNNKERQAFEFGSESWASARGWASSSVADLCASSTGSCLESAGPSEPGSSLSSSRRALFSRSSMSSSSRFLLGALTPAPSVADSAPMVPSGSQTSSSRGKASTAKVADQAGGPRQGKRRRCGEKGRSLTPAKNPSSPPYKRRKKTTKAKAKGKGRRSLQRTVRPRKSLEGRTSPRGKAATRTSPRTPPITRSRLRP